MATSKIGKHDLDEELFKKISESPDWNQNDETAPDYIKNRTHYIKKAGEEVLPETELIGMAIMSDIDELIVYDLLESNILLTVGNSYIVTWLGSEFELVAVESGFGPALGNLAINELGDDTGEPFLIITYIDDTSITRAYTLGTAVQGNVSIKCKNEEVYKLNKKYLPKLVGENIEGQIITFFDPTNDWEEITATAQTNAEIFNSYIDNEDLDIYRNIAVGKYSHAEGSGTAASGNYSHSEGEGALAFGKGSHAEGGGTIASGNNSHAEGAVTTASGKYSHAEGDNTTASGFASHAEGQETIASGWVSHAEGYSTEATQSNAHAEGQQTKANGNFSHAEGFATRANGESSHAEGNHTISSGNQSHAEGLYTKASGGSSHAEGNRTISSGYCSHAEGLGISTTYYPTYSGDANSKIYTASAWDGHCEIGEIVCYNNTYAKIIDVDTSALTITLDKTLSNEALDNVNIEIVKGIAYGESSHAEGSRTISSGECSHAEGYSTKANRDFSHAEGYITTASGRASHTEGWQTTASGESSHAEGDHTTASGKYSHAEGQSTHATGESSHAEGCATKANGRASHAEGGYTTASSEYQHVQGKFNIEDSTNTYVHIVGNGPHNAKLSNAHTLDWKGNAWFQGNIKVGGTGQDDATAKSVLTSDYITAGTTDLEAGVSALPAGHIYLVLEQE